MFSHISAADLERYLGRCIAPGKLLALDDHLAQCAECRDRLLTCSEAGYADFDRAGSGGKQPDAKGKRLFGAEGRVLSYGHLTYEAIADLVDDKLGGEELAAAVSHIRGCRECAAEWSGLQRFASQVAGTGSAVLVDRRQNEVSITGTKANAIPSGSGAFKRELYSFDSNYVDLLRNGDSETELHFVGYFRQLLRIKLRARYLSTDVIEDIVQETFARVFRTVHTDSGIRHPERIGAYVNSVCNFVLQEYYRIQRRQRPVEDDETAIPDKVLSLEQLAIAEEFHGHVREAIKALAPREQDIIRKIFFQEKEKDEVCSVLGVSRDYLRVLLHRAIVHLREILANSGALPKTPEPGKPANHSPQGTGFDSKDVN